MHIKYDTTYTQKYDTTNTQIYDTTNTISNIIQQINGDDDTMINY